MCDSLLFTIMDELVWLLPNACGKGREDHTKNMLCARCLLQDVRLDKNGERQEGGDVQRGQEGERSHHIPIPGEYFVVYSGAQR